VTWGCLLADDPIVTDHVLCDKSCTKERADIVKIGAWAVLTDQGIRPAALATALEERGFESCFLGEHSHVPVHRETPDLEGGEAVTRSLDLFVSLSAMATVTARLRVGTAAALVVERDPIHLAKEVATLDLLSEGRVELGIGAGWIFEEMRNHGTDPSTRFTLLRERIEAMKAIWTNDEAEFHGKLVDFDPIHQWPKPVQRPHPPILLASAGPTAHKRVVQYADGWLPTPMPVDQLTTAVAELQRLAEERGRPRPSVTATMLDPSPAELEQAERGGVDRVLIMLPDPAPAEVFRLLDAHAERSVRR
jgi:probable F420-dependent oxidoreductase